MCASSIQHHKSMALGESAKHVPEADLQSGKYGRRIRRLRMRYLGIVGLCLMLSVTCTVLEVFAAFNIEYCDGEDLMHLYWSFWSVLQVGSNIAIFGVMLQLWIALGNVKSPSWAVALGTPVLVFAALGWILREIGKVVLRKVFHRNLTDEESDNDDDDGDCQERGEVEWKTNMEKWLSRTPTLVESRTQSEVNVMRSDINLPRRATLAL